MLRREAAGNRLSRQVGGGHAVQLSLRGGEHCAGPAASIAKIPLQSRDAVRGARLDDVSAAERRGRAAFFARHRGQRCERRVGAEARRQFARPEYRRLARRIRIAESIRKRWTSSDAPGVEQRLRAIRIAGQGETEQTRALEEEGATLWKKSLEGCQVQHGGIGLDLTEIGIERRVQRDVGRRTELEIRAAGDVGFGAHREAWSADRVAAAREHIRGGFEPRRPGKIRQPFERSKV